MLQIALFDEDPSWLSELRCSLNGRKDSVRAKYLTDFEQLVNAVSKDKTRPDAIFLGLKHSEKSLTSHRAEQLSRLSRNTPILYIAENNEIWDQTILFGNINLVGFMTLPLSENVLDRYLRKISDLKEDTRLLTIKTRGKESGIRMDSILYLESRKHVVHIIADTGEVTTYAKLSELLPKLPSSFIQPHKSYLVNTSRISVAELNTLVLDNGATIPVSRARKNEVREKLHLISETGSEEE